MGQYTDGAMVLRVTMPGYEDLLVVCSTEEQIEAVRQCPGVEVTAEYWVVCGALIERRQDG